MRAVVSASSTQNVCSTATWDFSFICVQLYYTVDQISDAISANCKLNLDVFRNTHTHNTHNTMQ